MSKENRNQFMEQVSLFRKTEKKTNHGSADIGIRIISSGGDRKNYNIILRNKCWELFETEKINPILACNSLILVDDENGWKISRPSQNTRSVSIAVNQVPEQMKRFVGEWKLYYDDVNQFWYITRHQDGVGLGYNKED